MTFYRNIEQNFYSYISYLVCVFVTKSFQQKTVKFRTELRSLGSLSCVLWHHQSASEPEGVTLQSWDTNRENITTETTPHTYTLIHFNVRAHMHIYLNYRFTLTHVTIHVCNTTRKHNVFYTQRTHTQLDRMTARTWASNVDRNIRAQKSAHDTETCARVWERACKKILIFFLLI